MIHEDVDDRVPANGALGEEKREDGEERPHPTASHLVETDERVRKPADGESGYHE